MSSSSSRTPSALTIAGVAALGLAAYAVYFDYKRRTDDGFRKKLRKDRKRVDKIASSEISEASSATGVSTEELRELLAEIQREEVPIPPSEKETYFMSHVSMGEQLAMQGPMYHVPAAVAFFKALRVYPSPVELMVIYQKTVPEPIFKIVIEMTNLDARGKIEGYYTHFPPKAFRVAIETPESAGGKQVLIAGADFNAGDIIYTEHPVVAALDADLQAIGTHCTHCFRILQPDSTIRVPSDPMSAAYCSTQCQTNSKVQSHSMVFSLDPVLPSTVPAPEMITAESLETRRKAQSLLVQYATKEFKNYPILVTRYIGRQITLEMAKFDADAPKRDLEADYPDADGGDYTLADHVERLRFVTLSPPKEELDLITDVLTSTLPGLQQFIEDERFAVLVGKMGYNAFGVYFDNGREDRLPSPQRPEDAERTRSPVGTSKQIGSAFYVVSSYLGHSCTPNARPVFSKGTTELHLTANRDIKKGEVIDIAFVDVEQHEDESADDCRRRRRVELARGWKFACTCPKCIEEAGPGAKMEAKDESKVEEVVERQA